MPGDGKENMIKENEVIKNNVCIREETIEDWYAKHFPEYEIVKDTNRFIIRKKTFQKEISSITDSTFSNSNV